MPPGGSKSSIGASRRRNWHSIVRRRLKQGGHNVLRRDVLRRFTRSWSNFEKHERLFADIWSVYDNLRRKPKLLERSPLNEKAIYKQVKNFPPPPAAPVRRAAKVARKTACMHGPDLCLEERQSRR